MPIPGFDLPTTQLIPLGNPNTILAGSSSISNSPLLRGASAYWKMDEFSNSAASVSRLDSINGNTATDGGKLSSTTGVIGNGLLLDGTNFLTVVDSASLKAGDIEFCIDGWFNLSALPSTGIIVAKSGSISVQAQLEYAVYVSSAHVVFRVSDGTSFGTVTDTATLTTGVLHYFAAWHDPVANKIYVQTDNNAPVLLTWTTGIQISTNSLRFGADTAGRQLTGMIDEIYIRKAVPTADDLARRYAGGAGLSYPF